MFDTEMKMDVQVRHVCSSAWQKRNNISKIRHYLTDDHTEMVTHVYLTLKLDHNRTHLNEIPKLLSNRLQLFQNVVLILNKTDNQTKKNFDHVTPLLEELTGY